MNATHRSDLSTKARTASSCGIYSRGQDVSRGRQCILDTELLWLMWLTYCTYSSLSIMDFVYQHETQTLLWRNTLWISFVLEKSLSLSKPPKQRSPCLLTSQWPFFCPLWQIPNLYNIIGASNLPGCGRGLQSGGVATARSRGEDWVSWCYAGDLG